MENKPKKRSGNILIALGLLALAAALALVIYNVWDAKRAADASDSIVGQLDTLLPEERTLPEEPAVEEAAAAVEEAAPEVTED